jgi:hypothetical protein
MLNRSKAADSAQNQGTFTIHRALSLPSTVLKTIYNQHAADKEEARVMLGMSMQSAVSGSVTFLTRR